MVVQRFLEMVAAEAAFQLNPQGSREEFDELIEAVRRRLPAMVKAAGLQAVRDAIAETRPETYRVAASTPARAEPWHVDEGAAEEPEPPIDRSSSPVEEIEHKLKLWKLPVVGREEAAKLLSCSVDTIDRLCSEGKLESHTKGRKRLIKTESLRNEMMGAPSVCADLGELTDKDKKRLAKLRKG